MAVLKGCVFFSSRRRHTRLQGDWSSDVCSSDLDLVTPRPVDVASVQAKLRSLDELGSALRLVGEIDGARLAEDVLLRLAVERALTQAVDLMVGFVTPFLPP